MRGAVDRMLSNLRVEGMAVEDDPRLDRLHGSEWQPPSTSTLQYSRTSY
jgi:hypothetical protein